MLTDIERKEQARLARLLLNQKRVSEIAEKNKLITKSGNVPCYLSGMTESKKADKGFYYCANTSKINQLKYEIGLEKAKKPKIIRK